MRWMKTTSVALLSSLGWILPCCRADFGDFSDLSFACPATTTCPIICASTVEACPTSCRAGWQLCNDGTCAEACDEDLESPCECSSASIACPKVVDFYSECNEKYDSYYQAAEECLEAEEAAEIAARTVTFSDAPYIFAYIWVSVVSALIFAWCAWNQRWRPVSPVQVVNKMHDSQEPILYQVGYKLHWLGTILYFLTIATFAGWIMLLAFLTIQYYALDESPYLSRRKVHFSDEEQLLKTYIIVWSVGFCWCFALKWPTSIHSLFWRRCTLDQATVVALFQQRESTATSREASSAMSTILCCPTLDLFMRKFWVTWNTVWATIFSDMDGYQSRSDGSFAYAPVKKYNQDDTTRFVVFQLRRYNFESAEEGFVRAVLEDEAAVALGGVHEGLTSKAAQERLQKVGPNAFDMKEPYFIAVLGHELTKPFYTYQLFMIWSWFPLYYYYMAMVWSGVISTSAILVSCFHYRNLRNLYRLSRIEGSATVLRDGTWNTVDQKELVPGDIVQLETGLTYCDMILVEGGTCLVDESALTGESYPQAKVTLDPATAQTLDAIDRKTHKRQIIAAGTTILQVENNLALVWQTGSYTTKGDLLRQIVGYRRHSFKFDDEITVVLGILFLYAVFGFNMVVYFIEDTPVYGWFYGIYVVGTILPPLLPTVFTVSVGVSDDRLARKRVATANSESILVAGKVNRAFFDKTGTLTRQGLDFVGTRSVKEWELDGEKRADVIPHDPLCMAMSTCHSLSLASDGNLIGNPLDQTMFKAAGAKFRSNDKGSLTVEDASGRALTIVRHFDFDHHRMTQSVVVKSGNGSLTAFVKGSGESIQKICNADSIPADFEDELRKSARSGIYQIAIASKTLGAMSSESIGALARGDIETGLDFIGVIDFSNIMREETPSVIQQLREGEIISTMVTGDSVMTGIRIALESTIMDNTKEVHICSVDSATGQTSWTIEGGGNTESPLLEKVEHGEIQIAISGSSWNALLTNNPKEAMKLAPFIRVFGRCTPHDKVSVVNTFVDLGYVTLMTGDGSNDSGALRAAHVGVALSEAEASMVAPFSSLDKDIQSVLDVLKEGRCALASALATYKYMIMYGQIETINQIANAYFQITFSEWCWVFMDGIWTITMAFTLPLAKPADRLSNTRPTASILGLHTLSSALGVLMINLLFLVISLFTLTAQDWYQCRKWTDNDVSNVLVIGDNYESTVIFLVTGFQYISSAMAFNFGYEFRKAWWQNYLFVLAAATFTFMHFYITLNPGYLSCFWRVNCDNDHVVNSVTTREKVPIQNPFNTTIMPESFRVKILFIMIANTIAIMSYEYFVVNGLRQRWARQKRAADKKDTLFATETSAA